MLYNTKAVSNHLFQTSYNYSDTLERHTFIFDLGANKWNNPRVTVLASCQGRNYFFYKKEKKKKQ